MKSFLSLYSSILLLAIGCGEKDYSAEVEAMDQFVETINQRVDLDRSVVAVPGKILDNTTTVEYFDMDGELAKVLAVNRNEKNVKSIHFHLKNGQLVHVLFRYFRMDPDPYAEEVNSYLKDGKIYYATERKSVIEPEVNAGKLKTLPFKKAERSYQELFNAFIEYWQPALEAIEADKRTRQVQ